MEVWSRILHAKSNSIFKGTDIAYIMTSRLLHIHTQKTPVNVSCLPDIFTHGLEGEREKRLVTVARFEHRSESWLECLQLMLLADFVCLIIRSMVRVRSGHQDVILVLYGTKGGTKMWTCWECEGVGLELDSLRSVSVCNAILHVSIFTLCLQRVQSGVKRQVIWLCNNLFRRLIFCQVCHSNKI